MRKYSLVALITVVAALAMASTAGAAPFEFSNSATINVPDDASLTPPSSIDVVHPGLITRVEVRLRNVTHTRPADLDIMVETPSGDFIYLMSDQCGVDDVTNWDWEFADDHEDQMGTTNSSCGPVQHKPGDNFADTDGWSTAVGAAPVTTFAGVNGTNQTGTWRLHIDDDTATDTGSINSGWEISIDSTTPDALRIPPIGEAGTLGPVTKTVSGLPRTITDVDVLLNDLTHSHADDLDFALESPAGTKVQFASDGCGSPDRRNIYWVFDDESTTPYPSGSEAACDNPATRFAPGSHEDNETSYGAVLTGGPFSSSLSAFDGQYANGNWKLYINDDSDGDIGYIAGYDLAITIRGAKVLTPSDPTLKYKKSGKKNILATGRVGLAGEALTAGECAGSVKSSFQTKVVKKKGKKKVTSYKQVKSVTSALTDKAGKCGFDISAKLAKKYSGKKLRLVTRYLGGEYIAPFTRTTTEKIKKLKF